MSTDLRKKDIWPANQYARYVWLLSGLFDDILSLIETIKKLDDRALRFVVTKHMIIDIDSIDELIKEFQEHVKKNEIIHLEESAAIKMEELFKMYHKNLEPKRKKLKEIRNNLGAHRTGIPWQKSKNSKISEKDAWGQYEQYLIELEKECELNNWLTQLNSVNKFLNHLQDFHLDNWFSATQNGKLKIFIPIAIK